MAVICCMFCGLPFFKNASAISKYLYCTTLAFFMLCLHAAAQNSEADSTSFTFDGYSLRPGENPSEKIASNLFVKAVASTPQVFEGEALEVEYFLFSRVGFDGSVGKRPGFDGFSVIEMPLTIEQGTYRYQQAFGKTFKVYSLRRVQLTPLTSGKLPLPAIEVEGYVNFTLAQKTNGDPALQQTTTSRVAIANPPVFIQVMPLPALENEMTNIPPVGQFSIIATAPDQISVGRTQLLTISISGQGQWSQVLCPVINWPSSLIPFEPKVIDQLDSQRVPVRGMRVFQIPFEAKAPGKSVVPDVSFTYFDTKAGVYKTATTKPIPVTALQATASATNPQQSGNTATALFSRWAPLALAGIAVMLLVWIVWPKQKPIANPPSPYSEPFSEPEIAVSKQSLTSSTRRSAANIDTSNSPLGESQKSPAQIAAFQYKQLLSEYLQVKPSAIDPILKQRINSFLDECDAVLYGPPLNTLETQQLQMQYDDLLLALSSEQKGS